jgi:hypothetical protein
MKSKFHKPLIVLLSSQILLLMFLLHFMYFAEAQERLISIVDAETGEGSISLGSPTEPIPPGGYPFTVNVTLNGLTQNLFTFQVAIAYKYEEVKCTGAWLPKNDPNFVFYNKQIQPAGPIIYNQQPPPTPQGQPRAPEGYGYVMIGASLIKWMDAVTTSQAILCQINFTTSKTGTFTIKIIPTDSKDFADDTFLWDSNMITMPFSPQDFQVSVYGAKSPPIAAFTWSPQYPKPNQTVTFDASESYDPDGQITSYYWDFGDGTNMTETSPKINHTYTTYGPKYVTLTVTDNDGRNSSKTQTIYIGIPPQVSFTYDWDRRNEYPENPYMCCEIIFNATESLDPDGSIIQYVWNITRLQFQPKGVRISHIPIESWNETTTNSTYTFTPAKNSIYNITLTIYDNDGLYNTTSKTIFVGLRPKVYFTWIPETPMPDQEVIFNAYQSDTGEPYTYDEDGEIKYVVWDFYGEMEESQMRAYNITKREDLITSFTYFGQGGNYTVILTVVDDDGLYSSISRTISVTVLQNPEQSSIGWDLYIALAIIFALAGTVWYKRRPEKEPSPKERYRVI